MNPELFLDLTDYHSNTQWRWVLTDANGRFLADHEVNLDPRESVYRGFVDLPGYLKYYTPARSESLLLNELGRWMGEQVFGGIAGKLLAYEQKPARVVGVRVPPEAQDLLFRPYELAHIEGTPLAARGFRFIYSLTPGTASPTKSTGSPGSLRFLAVFSLPHGASPLNLRRERFQIKRLLHAIAQTRGLAVDLRVIQYGATRQTLASTLEESPGWDVIHFSGHGLEGELMLEKLDGRIDRVTAAELIPMLRPAKARLKLLTLSACLSGAADLQQARAQIGLENPPTRVTSLPATAGSGYTVLPSLAQRLASELDCAALAMRYPVSDTFATDLVLCLYRGLLEKKQPLPGALQLAIEAALHIDKAPQRAGFSMITPILFGERAAGLHLLAPARRPSFELEPTGLFKFPPEPPRFVGRLLPMLRASQALAPESGKTGVLFYGMAGAGKTSCALELAYRHEFERFTAFVWHKAPEEGRDIQDALTRLVLDMETQLPGLKLVGLVDDPQAFERQALPQLRRLMEQNVILIVIDNLEGLLTSERGWRDSRWGRLIANLLDHGGPSRLVLTSRRLPASLKEHPKLRSEAIHALSFRESVVLARELPNLKPLFDDPAGWELLQRVLRAVQGHPKLLELADRQAADRAALEARLPQAEGETRAPAATTLAAFFEAGESAQGEADFVAELYRWTNGLAATLTPTARLLFHFIARLEEEDRTGQVIEANWEDF
ncbi:MAG: CHAT domain-containing protein, partial [Chloroflexi bacterium]|nr:CHAT domain-containing protein [Chloroflexota bacterium]